MDVGFAIDDLCRWWQDAGGGDGTAGAARPVDLVGSPEVLKAVAAGAQARWTAQLAALRDDELAALPRPRGDRRAAVPTARSA